MSNISNPPFPNGSIWVRNRPRIKMSYNLLPKSKNDICVTGNISYSEELQCSRSVENNSKWVWFQAHLRNIARVLQMFNYRHWKNSYFIECDFKIFEISAPWASPYKQKQNLNAPLPVVHWYLSLSPMTKTSQLLGVLRRLMFMTYEVDPFRFKSIWLAVVE